MKSAHRHELETNALAQRLDLMIERGRPYLATVGGVLLALAAIMLIWSFISKSSATQQGAAWDAYNRALAGRAPNLEQLRQSAEEFPNTTMQQLADVTWADGQVYIAGEQYLYNREAAMASLDRAESAYRGVIQTSSDERIVNRAQLGLARIFEMRNQLDQAKAEYLKVKGPYAEYAKLQAERLEKPETKEEYAWLSKAQAIIPRSPVGPGTPGQRPPFAPTDIPLPGSATDAAAPQGASPATGPSAADSFEALLRSLEANPPADGQSTDATSPYGPATAETPAEPSSATEQPPAAGPPAPQAETPATPENQ